MGRIRICKIPDRSDADTGKLPACASPDIQKIGRGKRPYNSLVVLPADQRDRIRFLIIGAKLCKDLVPGNPDADGDPKLCFDPVADLFCDRHPIPFDAPALFYGQPGLITAEVFHLIGVLQVDFPCHPGKAKIQVHPGRDKDQIRTGCSCLPQRHPRLYAFSFCDVVCGKNDAVPRLRVSADCQRQSLKLRMMQHLNAGVKAVAVRMENNTVHILIPFRLPCVFPTCLEYKCLLTTIQETYISQNYRKTIFLIYLPLTLDNGLW